MKHIAMMITSLIATTAFAQSPTVPSAADINAKTNAAATQATTATQNATTQTATAAKDATTKATAAVADAKQKVLVNLNTASEQDLAKLPGIGPARAKAIIAHRPYTGVEDLKKVKGIKDGVIAKIKDKVTVQ